MKTYFYVIIKRGGEKEIIVKDSRSEIIRNTGIPRLNKKYLSSESDENIVSEAETILNARLTKVKKSVDVKIDDRRLIKNKKSANQNKKVIVTEIEKGEYDLDRLVEKTGFSSTTIRKYARTMGLTLKNGVFVKKEN